MGLATVCVAGVMVDPCGTVHDDYQARRDCRHDTNTPRVNGTVLQTAGVGAALLALGGILHLSGTQLKPRQVRPWRFKSHPPPTAPPPALNQPLAAP